MSEKIQYPCFATHAGPSVKPAAAEQAVPQSVRQAGRAALTAWWPDGLQGGQGRTESVRDEAGCSVRIDEGCSRRCVKDLHSRRRHLAVESVAHVRTWVSAAGSGTHTLGSRLRLIVPPDSDPRARCERRGQCISPQRRRRSTRRDGDASLQRTRARWPGGSPRAVSALG